MQYGRFDDENKEYVITNLFTPVKWINYIGTLDFGGFVDHTGGALICKGDPALNRITKYIPQMPASDFKGETAYLRFPLPDGSFQVVSPFHVPCATALDAWECHVGLGYTRIYSVINGLECDITIFVPPGSACEIRWYRFRNRSESTVSFDVIPVVEYSHFDALKQFTNADWVPQTMQSEAVYLAKTLILRQFAFMHRDTRSNYFTGNRPADSFETDRKIFLGNNEYGSWSNPLSLQQSSLSNHEARRGDNIAAIVYPFRSLAPGESQTLITQLGQTENVHTTASIPYYMEEKHVAAAFEELQHFWSNYLVKLQVQTPDSAFDSLINIHNPHQSYITFNWSRYLSLYQLGLGSRGLGTRDSSQDILAVLHTIPDQAVKLLRKLISIQTRSGYAMHQLYPLTMEASMGDATEDPERLQYYSDDHLWLVLAVLAYIKESGDFDFLDEMLPFYEKTKAGNPLESAPVRDHLHRAVNFSLQDVGAHGLCRLGFADWNDTFNLMPGSESCLSTCLLGMALKELTALAKYEHNQEAYTFWEKAYHDVKDNFNRHAWDGGWYRSYFDVSGAIYGSKSSDNGQIFAYGQAMAIMAGFADRDRATTALAAVRDQLNTTHGIKLSTPSFNGYDPAKGGVTTYPPGAKENCGIFMHVNPWVIIAEALNGNGDQAYQYHAQTNPALKNDLIERYECEPYVYAQNILSDEHPQFGLARNSWLSGTSAWMYLAATQFILGVQPTFDGLKITPCLPHHWHQVTIHRKFRKALYHITIQTTDPDRDLAITINGTQIPGTTIPAYPAGEYQVTVTVPANP